MPARGYETPKKRKALKQSKIRVQHPKIRLFVDHDSDLSTGTSKRSAMKMAKSRGGKSVRKSTSKWDDADRYAKSHATSLLKQNFAAVWNQCDFA